MLFGFKTHLKAETYDFCFIFLATVVYMARSVQIRKLFSDLAQARFLNFTIYLFYCKSSNLKIWRLSKYALTLN